jgi:predicted phosphoribosyltransferase
MSFIDRSDAGRKLAKALACYRTRDPVIVALPRGGVPVAAEIAKALAAPLDLVLVRKIGVPFQPELAMGAVVDGDKPTVIRNEKIIREAGVTEQDFEAVRDRELKEIDRRKRIYFGNRAREDLTGRTVILADDGIATGATARAALQAIRSHRPKRLVFATPVGPVDTLSKLESEVDHLVCLERYETFFAIGAYYDDFRQITDREVIDLLDEFPRRTTAAGTIASPPLHRPGG